jgi:arylsulfatase A-like enzyme
MGGKGYGTNVLLIVLSSARRDAFEPFGAPEGSTPAVAQLARRGVLAPDVRSTACSTLPAHAAIFTALLPRAAGLGRSPAGTPQSCRPMLEGHRGRLLPEVFRRAGWATSGVSTNRWISELSGFDVGFDRWCDVSTRRRRASTVRTARAVVELSATRPFFGFASLDACAAPYIDIGALARLRAARDARRYLSAESIRRACAGRLTVPEEVLVRMRQRYARCIRTIDGWLADVLGALDARGVLEETLVVVTSAHGENFGENGLMGHAFSLDDRLTHVPLIAAGPGAEELGQLISLTDMPRALARAVGIAHPWGPDLCAGVAISEFDPPADVAGADGMTAATNGSCKLVRRGGCEELFDLDDDPLELHALDPDDPRADELRAALGPAPAVSA